MAESGSSRQDILELEIGPAVHGGHALARHEGRVVFVRHAIPGELVRARVTEQRRKGYWRADAIDILQPSADRVPSLWPQAGPGGVGGGELAHVALPAQRRWKRDVVADALVRIGGLDADDPLVSTFTVSGVEGDESGWGSRTRVEMTVDGAGRAGMFRHRSHEVVALEALPLAVPAIQELGLLDRTWRAGVRLDAIAPSDGDPVVLVDGAANRGRSHVRERVQVGGVEHAFRLAASGFWQVHPGAPALLAQTVLDKVGPIGGARVVDAYSGAGLFSVPLSHAVGEQGTVLAIEEDDQANRDARRNAHGLPQLQLRAASVEQGLAELEWAPDAVVLDPPRAGAGPRVLNRIAELGAERIVYVACDPAALARDLQTALTLGYQVESIDGFDLFPHTHHLECVAVLTRSLPTLPLAD